jgi:hypothetical protein
VALVTSMGRLARGELPPERFATLDALRLELTPEAAAGLDPLDRADREQALASWLAGRGVQGAWTIAPALAAAVRSYS